MNVQAAELVQSQPSSSEPPDLAQQLVLPPGGTLSLIHVTVLLGWFVAIMAYLNRSRAGQISKENLEWQQHSHFPCLHCRFYHNSLYLRCAVHPTAAMTKQAIDCSDYQPS